MKNTHALSDKTRSKSTAQASYKSVLAAVVATMPLAVTTAAHADSAAASHVDAVVNFEISDKYLTPRGMIVHDHGIAFQPLPSTGFSKTR